MVVRGFVGWFRKGKDQREGWTGREIRKGLLLQKREME